MPTKKSPSSPGRPDQDAPIGGYAHQTPDEPLLDPIIDGLLERLPPPGDTWPMAERKLWLGILEQVFELIYDDEDDEAARTPDNPPGNL
jgi:hypothetical protein